MLRMAAQLLVQLTPTLDSHTKMWQSHSATPWHPSMPRGEQSLDPSLRDEGGY